MKIEIGKIGDRIIRFSLWIELSEVKNILADKDGNFQPAIRKECGNCHIVLGPNQNRLLSDRCKFEGWIVWRPVGNDSPEASDRTRIARFISELPNQDFVGDFTRLDQIYHWMEWKNECIWLAKCFLGGHGSPENPLLRALEEEEIDLYYYDQCWLSAELYENLWKLVSLKEKRIKAAFKKQGWDFSSPRIVLEQIIESDINGESSVVLKKYHDKNAKELKKLAKLGKRAHKGFGLAATEKKELTRLQQKYSQPNIWLERLLAITAALAEKDDFIRTRFEIHHALMHGITSLQLDAACKPHLKLHGQISATWINGQRFQGLHPKWRA